MKVAALVQARMGSLRLPGKVLKKIEGKPLIELLLKRLSKSKELDEIVVATSKGVENDKLQEFVEYLGYRCTRGSEKDVLNRFYESAKFIGADSKLNILDRKQLTRDIGHQLGKLHKLKIPSNQLRLFKKTGDQSLIDRLYTQLDLLPYSLPVIEWALRWLEKNKQ